MTKVVNPAGRLAGVVLARGEVVRGSSPGALLPDRRAGGTAPPASSENSSECYFSLKSHGKKMKVFCVVFFTVDSFWLFV